MANSRLFRSLRTEIRLLGKTYFNFKPRPLGNYTRRQMSAAGAYTIFCHAEFENYLEGWATNITDFAEANWKEKRATRPLVHLCTFHQGRGPLSSVPTIDVWTEAVILAIRQHQNVISGNNGIKEANLCKLLSPLGFDTRSIDQILLGDLSAFGSMRGDHAHQSHRKTTTNAFDPFDRKLKAEGLLTLLEDLDTELSLYLKSG